MRIGPVGLAAQNTDDDPVTGPLGSISKSLREAHRRFFAWHEQVGGLSCGENGASHSRAAPCMAEVHNGASHAKARSCTQGPVDADGQGTLQQGTVRDADVGCCAQQNKVHLSTSRFCMWFMLLVVARHCLHPSADFLVAAVINDYY